MVSNTVVLEDNTLTTNSPIASLLGDDSPKIILKGGLFEQIPVPGFKSFEQNEPEWMRIHKPSEK